MRISRITQWRRNLAFPRLAARIFPPPVSPHQDKPEIVDLRDPAEQKKLCEEARPFTTTSSEPWLRVIFGFIILAVLFVFLYIAL